MAERVDVVVVGLGPGGESAAAELARAGLSVVGIDARLVGGECPYYGCIPSKMIVRGAGVLAEARRVPDLAGRAQVEPDFAPVARRIEDATDDWDDRAAVERLEKAGVRFVRGRATITGPRTVHVGDQEFEATRAIVLNTGTEPAVPDIPGLAGTPLWTNREAIAASQTPASLIVLGGGAIGLELGQAFARFGTQVNLVEAADRLLPNEEPESGELIARLLDAEGIGVHTGTRVGSIAHSGGRFTVRAGALTLDAERLLVATGRRTNLEGLAPVGVDPGQKAVKTDEHGRVTEGVYAIGDITGQGAFTHVSMYQARIVTDHILGRGGPSAEYHAVPRVTFTDPEIGAVGLTERQARDQGIAVVTALTQLPDSSRGWIHHVGNDGFIKLVADTQRSVLVGSTSAGPMGGEVLSMLTLAVQERTPIAHLRRMMYAYPTFHRAIEDAVAQLISE